MSAFNDPQTGHFSFSDSNPETEPPIDTTADGTFSDAGDLNLNAAITWGGCTYNVVPTAFSFSLYRLSARFGRRRRPGIPNCDLLTELIPVSIGGGEREMSRPAPTLRRVRAVAIAAIAVAVLLPAGEAAAAPNQAACDNRATNPYQKLLECIQVSEVREHQAALQEIALGNDGNRFSGFSGL